MKKKGNAGNNYRSLAKHKWLCLVVAVVMALGTGGAISGNSWAADQKTGSDEQQTQSVDQNPSTVQEAATENENSDSAAAESKKAATEEKAAAKESAGEVSQSAKSDSSSKSTSKSKKAATTKSNITQFDFGFPEGTKLTDGYYQETAGSYGKKSVKTHLTFKAGGNNLLAADEIQIRLPACIYGGTNGDPSAYFNESALKTYVPGPYKTAADVPSGNNSFYYYIDDNGTTDDKTDDTIVIKNCKPWGAADAFDLDLYYTYSPEYLKQSADSSSSTGRSYTNSFKGTVSIPGATKTSETNKVKVITDVKLGPLYKSTNTKSETWNETWPAAAKPAEPEKYTYVVWQFYQNLSGYSTQPYTVSFQESIESPGEIIAYTNPNSTGSWKAGSQTNFNSDWASAIKVAFNDSSYGTDKNNSNSYYYIIAKYPKSQLTANKTVKNTIKTSMTSKYGTTDSRTTTAEYKYQTVQNEYTTGPGQWSFVPSKSGAQESGVGRIDILKNGGSINFTHTISSSTKAYGMTADTMTKNADGTYSYTGLGNNAYTSKLYDDYVALGNKILSAGDYSLVSLDNIKYTEYKIKQDENSGISQPADTDYANYKPVEVYGKVGGTWTKYATVQRTGGNTYTYTGENGATSSGTKLTLPANVTAIYLKHTSKKAGVDISANPTVKVNGTSNVKAIIGDSSSVSYQNIAGLKIDWKNGQYNGLGQYYLSKGDITDIINANDKAENGTSTAINRTRAENELSALKGFSTTTLSRISGPTTNGSGKYDTATFRILGGNYLTYSSDVSLDAAKAAVPEQKTAKLYTLLPAGTTVDVSSIKAYEWGSIEAAKVTGIQQKDNWKGTGRTMLIISAATNNENYYNTGGTNPTLYSGFYADYKIINTWDNIVENGNATHNYAAYQSTSGEYINGAADDGSTLPSYNASGTDLRLAFNDLNENGEEKGKTTGYAYQRTDFTTPSASETGFRKSVKNPDDTVYTQETTAMAGGDYRYSLRMANAAGTTAKNLIFYDTLESSYGSNHHWQGTFNGVDVSGATAAGASPVVYYSTKILTPRTDSNDELDNSSEWVKAAEYTGKLSAVKSVAIDLRKTADDADFTLGEKKAFTCYINMKATGDVLANMGKYNEDTDYYAYNQAVIQQTYKSGASAETTPNLMDCVMTKVKLQDPPYMVELEKTATPTAGDSEENAAAVAKYTDIDYDLNAKNATTATTVENVKLEDTFQTGLALPSTSDIKYYVGDKKTDLKSVTDTDSRVKVTISGQKLTWTIDKLAGSEEVHLVVPVQTTQAVGTIIKNNFKVTEYNDVAFTGIESNTTYHKISDETVASIEKTSDPKSGTEAAPKEIPAFTNIAYTIAAKNDRETKTLKNVKIEDSFDSNLDISKASEDTVVFWTSKDPTKKNISEDDNVSMNKTGNKITFTVKSMAAGEKYYFTVDAGTKTGTAGTVIKNKATIIGYNGGDVTIDSDYTYHKIAADDSNSAVKIEKSSSPASGTEAAPTEVAKYTTVLYTLKVSNIYDQDVENVKVSDAIPEGLVIDKDSIKGGTSASPTEKINAAVSGQTVSVNIDKLAKKSSYYITIPVKVNAAEGTFVNQAKVTGYNGGTLTKAEESNKTYHKATASAVSIEKTSDPASGTETKPADVAMHSAVMYTLKIHNSAAESVKNVAVEDDLPAGMEFDNKTGIKGGTSADQAAAIATTVAGQNVKVTIPEITAGGDYYITVPVKVEPTKGDKNKDGDYIFVNQAKVTGYNGSALDEAVTSEKTYHKATMGSLDITKSVDKTIAEPGDTLTYTIKVKNSTAVGVENAIVTDTVPEGLTVKEAGGGTLADSTMTWSIGSVAANSEKTIAFTAAVPEDVKDGHVYKNSAAVNYTDPLDPGDAASNEVETKVEKPIVGITKAVDKTEATPGEDITYTINVKNDGSGTAKNVVVTDKIPEGLKFKEADNNGTEADGTVTWNVGTMAANSEVTLTFTAMIPTDAVNGTIYKNTAEFTQDKYPEGKSEEVETKVLRGILEVAKTADVKNPAAGDSVNYTITAENKGGTAVSDATIEDTIPEGMTFVSASGNGTYANGIVTWSIGDMNVGDKVTVTVALTAAKDAKDDTIYKNVAKASGDKEKPYDTEATAEESVSVTNPPQSGTGSKTGTTSKGSGTVAKYTGASSTKTGDDFPTTGLIVLLVLAGAAAVLAVRRREVK